jgi:hypothetical protein
MRFALIIVLLWCGPAAADISKYRCQAYLDDKRVLSADSSIKLQELGSNHAEALGFTSGAYYGATGTAPSIASKKKLRIFEVAIEAECREKPKARFQDVVLGMVPKPDSQSKPLAAVERQSGKYRQISLTDLKLDISKLKGSSVEVTGVLQTMGELSMISDGVFDMNKVWLETKKLSRESRKFILENCDSGCNVRVRGKVAQVMFQMAW